MKEIKLKHLNKKKDFKFNSIKKNFVKDKKFKMEYLAMIKINKLKQSKKGCCLEKKNLMILDF
jgi:hypothetical protein